MTDLELKKNVEAELNWEPSLNAAEIGVAVRVEELSRLRDTSPAIGRNSPRSAPRRASPA